MRITALSSVHQIDDIRILRKECVSLAAAGHEVSYVAPSKSSDEFLGVNRIGVHAGSSNRAVRMATLTGRVLRGALRTEADVYHFHDPEMLPFAALLKVLGKTVIFDSHETTSAQLLSKPYLPRWLRRPISIAYRLLESFVLSRLDVVICATPAIKRDLAVSRSVLIRNFPLDAEIRSKARSLDDLNPHQVVFVGGFSRIRGAIQVVDALQRVNDIHPCELLLVGSIENGMVRELERRPGWQYVRHVGQVDRDLMNELVSSAAAGICTYLPEPNHVEALPNKLLEYMAQGLAVIASDFDSWKDLVDGNAAGLCVDPTNAAGIADAILKLATSPELALDLGENGRRAVATRYSWSSEASLLLDTYALLGNGNTRS